MKKYSEMSKQELKEQYDVLNKEYADAKAKGLKLDMSRGKPSPSQLSVSDGLLDVINSSTGITVIWREFRKQESLWVSSSACLRKMFLYAEMQVSM